MAEPTVPEWIQKRPVQVQAMQWPLPPKTEEEIELFGSRVAGIYKWVNDEGLKIVAHTEKDDDGKDFAWYSVETQDDVYIASPLMPGDYLIKDIGGFELCKHATYDKLYQPLSSHRGRAMMTEDQIKSQIAKLEADALSDPAANVPDGTPTMSRLGDVAKGM